jgi:hypothetical protein
VDLQNDATCQDPLAYDHHDGNCIPVRATVANNDKDEGESDNDGDVDGPTVEAHVDLAKVPCKYCMSWLYTY